MGSKRTLFARKSQLTQGLLQIGLEGQDLVLPILDPEPDRAWTLQAGKRADALAEKAEGKMGSGHLLNGEARPINLSFVHIAQEFQRQVEFVGCDPSHTRRGVRQLLDHGFGLPTHGGIQVHGDEGTGP